jgi:hypothetical protein
MRWNEFRGRYPDTANGLVLLAILVTIVPIAGHFFYWRFVAVFFIGMLVGAGEIVARYRDAPESALWTISALIYVGINAAAGVVVLLIIQSFHYVEVADAMQTRIRQGLLAGFGAMAFFRSSVFTVRVGESDVAIGPAAFLQVVLRATDRAVDRIRAKARAEIITKCMNGIAFDRSYSALPAFCLQLMQNVSSDEYYEVGKAIKSLKDSPELDDDTKVKNLGLILLNVVGESVLTTAIDKIGQQLHKTIAIKVDPVVLDLKVHDTFELTATCLDSSEKAISQRQPDWSPDDANVATTTPSGHVVAVSAGTTLIRAKSDGAEARVLVTVTL